MADHLVLKGGTWHVRLDVPEDVRDHPDFLAKKVLTKTLKTGSRAVAKDRSREILAAWKRSFEAARTRQGLDSWRIRAESSRQKINDMLMQARTAEDFESADSFRQAELGRIVFEYRLNIEEAEEAKKIFFKNHRPKTIVSPTLIAEFERYQSENQVIEKTAASQASSIKKIIQYLQANDLHLDHTGVEKYLSSLPFSDKTKQNRLFAGNAFWNFLISKDNSIKSQNNPFKDHILTKKRGKNRSQSASYIAFEKHEVERLHQACIENGDLYLAATIKIAAYTGCRIEEICRIRPNDIINNTITIKNSKTETGNRTIPIHSKIKKLLEKFSSTPKDGYIIHSSAGNKYGNRSDPLSKRFGRLKKELGFEQLKVFHSIRKTTTTLLQQADVPPLVITNIVGHKTNHITFDIYSKGSSILQMSAALEKLDFSFCDD